jgi:lipoprotein-releasing system permease protein
MVAFRYLRARRREGFISIIAWFSLLGIALGVATLIIVMSVMNGFKAELLDRILGLNGHVGLYATGPAGITDFDALAGTVAKVQGVVSVTPMIEGQVMATSRAGGASGALVRGIRPDDLMARAILRKGIKAGDLKAFTGDDAVIVGDRLAEKMGLRIGEIRSP